MKIHLIILFGVLFFQQANSSQESLFFPSDARDWRRQYIEVLKKDVCKGDQFINECFGFNPKKCLQVVDQEFNNCHNKVRMPASLSSYSQSIQIGSLYGKCIGNQLEIKYTKNRVHTPKCMERGQW